MVDHTRTVGTAGTMIIRDHGADVEFLVACADGATAVGSYVWSGMLPTGPVGGTTSLPAGFGTKSLGRWPLATTYDVLFHQNATGTQGLGGAADITALIPRGTTPPPTPVPPGPPVPLGFSDVTTTSMKYLWHYGTLGTHPITSRAAQFATSADFTSGASVWFPVDESGTVPMAGMVPGVEYFWRVRVQSDAGLSPNSPVTSQRTLGGVTVSDGTTWEPADVFVSDGQAWRNGAILVSDGTVWEQTS